MDAGRALQRSHFMVGFDDVIELHGFDIFLNRKSTVALTINFERASMYYCSLL